VRDRRDIRSLPTISQQKELRLLTAPWSKALRTASQVIYGPVIFYRYVRFDTEIKIRQPASSSLPIFHTPECHGLNQYVRALPYRVSSDGYSRARAWSGTDLEVGEHGRQPAGSIPSAKRRIATSGAEWGRCKPTDVLERPQTPAFAVPKPFRHAPPFSRNRPMIAVAFSLPLRPAADRSADHSTLRCTRSASLPTALLDGRDYGDPALTQQAKLRPAYAISTE